MRCNAWRWLWGLIPLAIVWWIGILSEHDGIEADLKRRGEAALAAANASWAGSSFSGRDATLTGGAADAAERQAAAEILSKVWGIRKVDNRVSLADRPVSYVWSAVRSDKRVDLSGYVPSEAARQAVLGNARTALQGVPVEDGLRVAGGVGNAEQWLGSIKFALGQVASLRNGRVEVADGGLSVEGEALDSTRYAALKEALGGLLPSGLALKSDKVTAPAVKPYTWTAVYRAKRLEFTGHAPGERQRDMLIAAARTGLPGAEVASKLAIATGEPRGWQSATGAVLGYLARMSEGRAELVDQQLKISGIVDDEAVAELIRQGLSNELPSGYRVAYAIELSDKAASSAAAAKRQRDEADEVSRRRAAAAADDAARQRAAAEEDARQRADAAARAQAADAAARAKAAAEADAAARAKAAADAAVRAKASSEAAARAKAEADAAAKAKAAADAAQRAKTAVVSPEVRASADRCQSLLTSTVSKGTINFQRASAELSPGSFATLDALAKIASECPKVEIDIVGHTDSEGTAERNQRLSERRAGAVAEYLSEIGVERPRLHAIGFGDSQPIAPNDSSDNRAKNRRIEFVVRIN